MGDKVFDYEIKIVERHMEILWQYVNELAVPQKEFVGQVLEHLSNTLEELRVTREELRRQNEELIAAQQTLEAERQRYRELFEFAPDGYLVTNASGVIEEANRTAAALFSVSRHFLLGKPLTVFVFEGDRKSFYAKLNRLKKLKRVQDVELRLRSRKGAPFHASITVAAVRNPREKLIGLRWSIRDVTERKRAEETLRESEERFKVFMDNSPSVAFIKDEEGRYIYINEPFERLFKVKLADLQGKTDFEWLPEETAKQLRENDRAVLSTGKAAEITESVPTPDGCPHYWLVFKFPIRDASGRWFLGGVAVDITERKRADEALRESLVQLSKKNRYETIISTVTRSVHKSINLQEVLENAVDAMSRNIGGVDNVSIYMVEGQEAIIKAYRGYPEWFIERAGRIPYQMGFTWRVIIDGKPIYCADVDRDTIIGPAGREMGTKSYISMPVNFEGKTVGAININSLRKNAFDEEEIKLLEIIAQQIEIAINNAQQAELLYRTNEELELRVQERTQKLSETNEELKREIAWRKQAEKALRNSEEQYRTLYENNPSMYFTTDKKGRILSLNQFGAEQLGYMAEELIGQSVLNVFYEDDKKAVLDQLASCLQSPTKVAHWEFRKVRKDGSVLWVRESARAVRRSDGGTVVLIVCDDITERRRAEEQLKGSLKEKEMLLKEVHHRVKNNLQVVSSLLDLQTDYLNDKQAIEIICKSRNRVRSMALVHERLYQSKDMARVDFAEYIRDLTDNLFCSYGINSNKVKLNIDAEDVLLNINSAIPCGLIINELVSNSLKYAFPRGKRGEISISLRSDSGGSDSMGRTGFTLIVSNNGVGFPRTLDFRKTESLGLQLVIALVEQIGGAIELDRTNGVKFKITFTEPRSEEETGTLIR